MPAQIVIVMKPNQQRFFSGLTLLTLVSSAGMAMGQGHLLTFDDLAAPAVDGSAVPNGYGGLQWDNLNYLDGLSDNLPGPNGYVYGIVSPDNVAFNANSQPGTITGPAFTLNSADLTGAWRDGLQVEVQGYVGNTLTYDNTYTVNSTGPTLVTFDYVGVDKVVFSTSGGTFNPVYDDPAYGPGIGKNAPAEEFAMDNVTINSPVPEPSTFALIGLALIPLAFRSRSKC